MSLWRPWVSVVEWGSTRRHRSGGQDLRLEVREANSDYGGDSWPRLASIESANVYPTLAMSCERSIPSTLVSFIPLFDAPFAYADARHSMDSFRRWEAQSRRYRL